MLIALFGLIAITAGVTYAFFSYAKEGTTDNTLTTGTITSTCYIRPVINLKADTAVTGSGTSDSHWIVQ